MGQPQSTSTTITYGTTGVCTATSSFASAATCSGTWTESNKTCVQNSPQFTVAYCSGTWKAVGGQATTTTPAPTPDPACACKGGDGCAQSSCNSCVISKVCTNVFPTKDECLAFTNTTAKWCGK